jgi:similar to stage IV sporulation protein
LGDSAALSRTLDALGVRPGIDRSMDTGLLAQRLLARTDSYSYAGVRLQGVRLLVEAAPEAPSPALYDVNAARDLVCAREGIVVRVVARSGMPCVRPGDAVRRGQVLIRGEEQASKEQMRPIGALGEVIVRSWFSGEARLPLTQTDAVDTGRRSTGARLALLGLEWPISEAATYPSQRTERDYLPVGGLFVPLEIERYTNVEVLRQDSEIPREILQARAGALSLANARTALFREGPREYIPDDSWVDYKIIDDVLIATTVIEIQSDAAVTREALQGG